MSALRAAVVTSAVATFGLTAAGVGWVGSEISRLGPLLKPLGDALPAPAQVTVDVWSGQAGWWWSPFALGPLLWIAAALFAWRQWERAAVVACLLAVSVPGFATAVHLWSLNLPFTSLAGAIK